MKIAKNTVPSISYELVVEGEMVDKATNESPLVFLFGAGNLLPEFESNLDGLEPGNEFSFQLSAENGYGEFNPQAIVDLPIDTFKVDGKVQNEVLVEGKVIPMQDQNGNPLQGRVMNVSEENVKMDFNHPLAGKELAFSGKIEDVREAEKEEIEHGHVHGKGGVQH